MPLTAADLDEVRHAGVNEDINEAGAHHLPFAAAGRATYSPLDCGWPRPFSLRHASS
jgi:hypothetical protein